VKPEKSWQRVDEYFAQHLLPADPVLRAALDASASAGLPAINVAPNQGKLLMLLARLRGARRILEIGTLGGYSTIWLARALPANGRLITLEAESKHADVARGNVERAGLSPLVEIRLGAALDSLRTLAGEQSGPFDFVFIDADKPNTLGYFEWALRLSRPGTLIVVDNVVRNGGLADQQSSDANVQAMRKFIEALGRERRVTATAIQTVGIKGHDGFAIALVEK
jgi:predicted O-methyltransferase YrrM